MENNSVLMITSRADVGGGPEHLFQLSKAISNDFFVYIATPNEEPYWEKFSSIVGENKCIKIPHRKLSLRCLLVLRKFIIENKIGIVHSHGKGAGVYSRLLKVIIPSLKVVHTLHGYHDGQYSFLGKSLYSFLEYFFSILTNKIINVSQGEQDIFVATTKVCRNKCCVIYNGVAIDKKQTRETNSFEEKDVFKVCYLGRDGEQKNILELIAIAEFISKKNSGGQIVFDVYGNVDFGLDSNINSDICYKGAVSGLREKMHKYDLLLNTSKWEGMPISVLEAMAEGIIVLATNVVGNNNIIKDQVNGFLYPLGDVEKASAIILNLVENKNELDIIKVNAFHCVNKKYSIKAMREKTLSVYGMLK